MQKSNIFTKISKVSGNIFIISLLIFLLSLIPVSYNSGYLSGAAGVDNIPPSAQTNNDLLTSNITIFSSIIGGISAIITVFMSALKARFEFITQQTYLKKAQLERDMQLSEIEKLRLELELEKRTKKAKRK